MQDYVILARGMLRDVRKAFHKSSNILGARNSEILHRNSFSNCFKKITTYSILRIPQKIPRGLLNIWCRIGTAISQANCMFHLCYYINYNTNLSRDFIHLLEVFCSITKVYIYSITIFKYYQKTGLQVAYT